MSNPYNASIEKIAVYIDGNEIPFYIHASMFESFVEWFAEQRGVSIEQAEIILKNE